MADPQLLPTEWSNCDSKAGSKFLKALLKSIHCEKKDKT